MPLSPFDNKPNDSVSDMKVRNFGTSKTKGKAEDYTKPSLEEETDTKHEVVEEEYETPDNRKNPEKDYGKPGVRTHQDSFADVGLPDEESILPPEDETPVAEDDGNKHGSKNKYRLGGDEGKTGPE